MTVRPVVGLRGCFGLHIALKAMIFLLNGDFWCKGVSEYAWVLHTPCLGLFLVLELPYKAMGRLSTCKKKIICLERSLVLSKHMLLHPLTLVVIHYV